MKKILTTLIAVGLFLTTLHAQQIKVSYTPSAFNGPFSGHVIVYLSKTASNPRKELDIPVYGKIVKSIKPDEKVTFDKGVIFSPKPLTQLERGTYYIQAVWDRNLGGRNIGTSPGNMYNKSQQVTL